MSKKGQNEAWPKKKIVHDRATNVFTEIPVSFEEAAVDASRRNELSIILGIYAWTAVQVKQRLIGTKRIKKFGNSKTAIKKRNKSLRIIGNFPTDSGEGNTLNDDIEEEDDEYDDNTDQVTAPKSDAFVVALNESDPETEKQVADILEEGRAQHSEVKLGLQTMNNQLSTLNSNLQILISLQEQQLKLSERATNSNAMITPQHRGYIQMSSVGSSQQSLPMLMNSMHSAQAYRSSSPATYDPYNKDWESNH